MIIRPPKQDPMKTKGLEWVSSYTDDQTLPQIQPNTFTLSRWLLRLLKNISATLSMRMTGASSE